MAATNMHGAQSQVKKIKRYFNEIWKKEFIWLDYNLKENLMFCIECKNSSELCKTNDTGDNAFVRGCNNFQRDALTRHASSRMHKNNILKTKHFLSWQKMTKTMKEKEIEKTLKYDDSKLAVFRSVYWLAKEEIPNVKFNSLIELQRANGSLPLSTANRKYDYHHSDIVNEMQASMSKVLYDADDRIIKTSNFISIILDETTDISIMKKLAIFCTVISEDSLPQVIFMGNHSVINGEAKTIVATVIELLIQRGIGIEKVVGLGSDGAAVMLGKHNGVGAKLKMLSPVLLSIHCAAHRLSLASSQAGSGINYFKKFQSTIDSIYRFFSNSAIRYNKLRELESVLDLDVVALKEPKPIRWLSILPAIEAIDKIWPAIVMALEAEALKMPIAAGLVKEIKNYHFVALLKVLLDILPLLQKLCKFFQREDLNLSMIKPILTATISAIENVKVQRNSNILDIGEVYKDIKLHNYSDDQKNIFNSVKDKYLTNLISNLNERFPDECITVLEHFDTIFNPQKYPKQPKLLQSYGEPSLNVLLDHYKNLVDTTSAISDYSFFKQMMVGLSGAYNFKEVCSKLCNKNDELHEMFPAFAVLANIALVMPMNSVSCERAFSAQNRIKCSQRSCIKDANLNVLMKIAIDGPNPECFHYNEAIKEFELMKERRKM